MTEKFTKGPWKATYDSQLQALIEIYNTEDRVMVAVLPDRGTIEAMSVIEANATLIAAAPDMYEALDYLFTAALKVCDDFCCDAGCSQDARDCKLEGGLICAEIALRKARGETE